MARKKTELVLIRALVSFNGMHKGDEATVERNPRVQGWINAGLMEVLAHGTVETGQGGTQPDDDQRVTSGVEGSVSAGGEPGSSFGAGPYGSSAGIDKG